MEEATPPDPTTETPGTPGECPVVGCDGLGLARHETPNGVVYLCIRCDGIARRNLDKKAAEVRLTDALAELLEPSIALNARREARMYGRS